MWSIWLAAFALTILDFVTKSWARTALSLGASQQFVPGLLRLTLTTNKGGAFGLGREYGYTMTVVAFLIFAAIIVWVALRLKAKQSTPRLEKIGMACLLGGAMGNLFDRLQYGQVTDFLEFSFVSFPVFNVADATIDVGIALIFISYLMSKSLRQ